VAEQIFSMGRDARSQVESICSSSSLTPQQKRQQVREIRQQAMQKREALVAADQQKAFRACQQARRGNRPGGRDPHEGLGGECGEMPRNGSRPSNSPNGTPSNGTSSPPPSNQSSPQN